MEKIAGKKDSRFGMDGKYDEGVSQAATAVRVKVRKSTQQRGLWSLHFCRTVRIPTPKACTNKITAAAQQNATMGSVPWDHIQTIVHKNNRAPLEYITLCVVSPFFYDILRCTG